MAFPFLRTRGWFNQSMSKAFAPIQQQALRDAFTLESGAKSDALPTNATSTFVKDPDLKVTVLAGVLYRVKSVLYITTTATPGFKIDQAAGTAVASFYTGKTVFATAAGASQVVIDVAALNTAQNPAAAAYVRVEHDAVGYFSTGGTLGIEWAQSVTNATASSVNAGSYLMVEPLTAIYSR